jgi:glutaconate CoA-transferase subunit B
MDFEEESKRMRLRSLHPGVSADTVRENTGFDLVIPPSVPETEVPTAEELEMLRTRVDLAGRLRR